MFAGIKFNPLNTIKNTKKANHILKFCFIVLGKYSLPFNAEDSHAIWNLIFLVAKNKKQKTPGIIYILNLLNSQLYLS